MLLVLAEGGCAAGAWTDKTVEPDVRVKAKTSIRFGVALPILR